MNLTKTLFALLLACSMHGCCASSELRQAASNTCDDLSQAMHAREKAHRQLVESNLVARLQALRSAHDARWELLAVELRLQVSERIDAKRRELCQHVSDSIDTALAPRLEEMSKALDSAKAEVAAGTVEGKKRSELALQLAATMTFAQQAILELQEAVDVALEKVRVDALARIDTQFATNPAAFDPAVEAASMLRTARGDEPSEFEISFDRGLTEVQRFIALDSPIALAMKGLFGDSLGDRVLVAAESFGQKKLTELLDAAKKKAGPILADLNTKATDAVASIRK